MILIVDHPNPNRLDFTEARRLRMTKATVNVQKIVFCGEYNLREALCFCFYTFVAVTQLFSTFSIR